MKIVTDIPKLVTNFPKICRKSCYEILEQFPIYGSFPLPSLYSDTNSQDLTFRSTEADVQMELTEGLAMVVFKTGIRVRWGDEVHLAPF